MHVSLLFSRGVVGISGQILAARLVFLTNPDGANAWVEEKAKIQRRAAAGRRMLILASIVIMDAT
jgi:hypothetical protein